MLDLFEANVIIIFSGVSLFLASVACLPRTIRVIRLGPFERILGKACCHFVGVVVVIKDRDTHAGSLLS